MNLAQVDFISFVFHYFVKFVGLFKNYRFLALAEAMLGKKVSLYVWIRNLSFELNVLVQHFLQLL